MKCGTNLVRSGIRSILMIAAWTALVLPPAGATQARDHPFELLVAGPVLFTSTDVHDGATADHEPDFAVPNDPSLLGLPWAAQGTVVGGGRIDMTSARCGVVGSIDAVADP